MTFDDIKNIIEREQRKSYKIKDKYLDTYKQIISSFLDTDKYILHKIANNPNNLFSYTDNYLLNNILHEFKLAIGNKSKLNVSKRVLDNSVDVPKKKKRKLDTYDECQKVSCQDNIQLNQKSSNQYPDKTAKIVKEHSIYSSMKNIDIDYWGKCAKQQNDSKHSHPIITQNIQDQIHLENGIEKFSLGYVYSDPIKKQQNEGKSLLITPPKVLYSNELNCNELKNKVKNNFDELMNRNVLYYSKIIFHESQSALYCDAMTMNYINDTSFGADKMSVIDVEISGSFRGYPFRSFLKQIIHDVCTHQTCVKASKQRFMIKFKYDMDKMKLINVSDVEDVTLWMIVQFTQKQRNKETFHALRFNVILNEKNFNKLNENKVNIAFLLKMMEYYGNIVINVCKAKSIIVDATTESVCLINTLIYIFIPHYIIINDVYVYIVYV